LIWITILRGGRGDAGNPDARREAELS